jgi:hypothetical protein
MSGLARIALFMTTGALAVALGACGAGDGAAKHDYVSAVNIAQAQFAGAATLMVNARLRTAIDAINGKLRGS